MRWPGSPPASGPARCATCSASSVPPPASTVSSSGSTGDRVEALRSRVGALAEQLGHRPRIVIGKPGLDGHSNGAEVIAVSARHVGFDVIYSGIRLSPDEIVQSAVEEDADVIGASVL